MPLTDLTNPTAAPYSQGNPKHVNLADLDTLSVADYDLTPDAIKAYLFGLNVVDPNTGKELPDTFYKRMIQTKIALAEHKLDIAIFPRLIQREKHDMYEADVNSYNNIKLYKHPVIQVESMEMQFGLTQMMAYPSQWWRVYNLFGSIQAYPLTSFLLGNGVSSTFNNAALAAMFPYGYGYGVAMAPGSNNAPQVFSLDYVAGMLPAKNGNYNQDWEIPASLQELILKYCLIEILEQWGKLILGAGIAEKEITMDGISERVVTTQSAMYTGSAADIDLVRNDIASLEASLKSKYVVPLYSV
jgi:hypothetical protein